MADERHEFPEPKTNQTRKLSRCLELVIKFVRFNSIQQRCPGRQMMKSWQSPQTTLIKKMPRFGADVERWNRQRDTDRLTSVLSIHN